MVPERVRTVTTATYEAVGTDQEFTISELEDVLYRLKDTAPGDDTVCYSMIKNTPLSTRHIFLQTHQPVILRGETAQPINPYSLGFRSGGGTIDAIATLIHTAAQITALRSGYNSRSATIFLDLEKAFELVSKEVLLE